jgi:hypothetical protein
MVNPYLTANLAANIAADAAIGAAAGAVGSATGQMIDTGTISGKEVLASGVSGGIGAGAGRVISMGISAGIKNVVGAVKSKGIQLIDNFVGYATRSEGSIPNPTGMIDDVVNKVDDLADDIGTVKGTSEIVARYNPINKDPLPDAVAKTFRSSTYSKVVTQQETTLYRVYGGKAGEIGGYWTRTKPQGPLQAVIDSALDQNWGNTATEMSTIIVPKGTTMYEGAAAAQRGLVGGGNQIFIESVDPSWLVK